MSCEKMPQHTYCGGSVGARTERIINAEYDFNGGGELK